MGSFSPAQPSMSTRTPTLIFIPGAWHKPSCYDKVITPLQEHGIKCVKVTLPSTQDNPDATFKDDIDAARAAILAETEAANDVIVIAHSYGGMVGNSCIKGFTAPKDPKVETGKGYVKGLMLIASGFTITGLSFMDPLMGLPLPFFRADKASGYCVLTADPREFFYHDVAPEDADHAVRELTTHSIKSLYKGGEHAYAGWMDVPVWYIGTIEDRGLPVVAQRMQVSVARAVGTTVHHTELRSSHSPFLSMPGEVVRIMLDAVESVCGSRGKLGESEVQVEKERNISIKKGIVVMPRLSLFAPGSWFKFGIPLLMGRMIGWGAVGFMAIRKLWR